MREEEGFALRQIRRNVFLVSGGLFGIRERDEDDIRAANSFGSGDDFKTSFLRDRDGFAAFVEANDDVETALFKVQRVGVALRAEAENSQCFVLKHAEVSVLIVVYFGGHIKLVESLNGYIVESQN